ncbi:MAG TPA: TolC family protein, partial [Proteobacteria bacterium]|nr:TolC family protein [Pseudomonadota bacterium]
MIQISRPLNSAIFSGVLLLVGCATYHPAPITSEKVQAELTPPDMNEVRIQADEFSHPLLEPVHFDDRDGLSPEEAAILAVIANPALRAIRDRRGLASAQLLQAGLLPNPQLSYDLGIPVGGNTAGRVNRHDLSLGWEITSLIARGANMDAARARLASVDLEVAWQEWQVAEAARLHLYRLIIAEKRLAAAKKAAASFQRFFEDVKQSVTLGIKTRIDLSSAETILREARSQLLNAQLTLDRERLSLNQALGFPAGKVIPLQKNIVPRLKECPPVETLFREAEAGRFDLLALKLGYESQEARLRSAVRSQFPKINLGLAGGRDTDDIQTVGVGVSIDLP